MTTADLPVAPARLVHERGIPAFGMYRGLIGELSWQGLAMPPRKRLTRLLHHKRWQYAAFAHDDFFIGVAVVHAGWIGSAFAYVFDRQQGVFLGDYSAVGPGIAVEPRAFGDATFTRRGERVAFRHAGQHLALTVNTDRLRLAAHIELPPAESVLAAIAPANWLAHATHKSGALRCHGFAEAGTQHLSLDNCIVSLDASTGLLARETAWRWASAHSHALGFNLQAGYMGDAENALWLEGRPWRVGPACFDYDAANPQAPWHIHTTDGAIDLTFMPEGLRREDKDLWLAASRYVQPVGRFDGHVRHPQTGTRIPVRQLTGVTEDHHSRW